MFKENYGITDKLIPVGGIVGYIGPKSTIVESANWLICDGRSVLKESYPILHGQLGELFGGSGDSFNLPDLRGQFLRGVDDTDSGSIDPDRESRKNPIPFSQDPINQNDRVGTRQEDELPSHQHNWNHNFGERYPALLGVPPQYGLAVQLAWTSSVGANLPPQVATNVDGGGLETRPTNVYVYYLIYAGEPGNEHPTSALPPVGSIVSFLSAKSDFTDSDSWLECDGTGLAKKKHQSLADVIGTLFGGSDDTFNLPDLRGQFLRGVDDTVDGTIDPDRTIRTNPNSSSTEPIDPNDRVGTRQAQQLKNHQHQWDHNYGGLDIEGNDIAVKMAHSTTQVAPNQGRQVTTNNDGGGEETRPVNVYAYHLIYAGQ